MISFGFFRIEISITFETERNMIVSEQNNWIFN